MSLISESQDNHQALGSREYGSNNPLPIWIEYMQTALRGVPESFPDQPDGVVTMKIDPVSGELAAPRKDDAIFEFFLVEHVPEQPATDHTTEPGSNDNIKAVDIF